MKERILELYLNKFISVKAHTALQQQSLEYFDRVIKELNYADAALLAAHYLKPQVSITHINIQKLQNFVEI